MKFDILTYEGSSDIFLEIAGAQNPKYFPSNNLTIVVVDSSRYPMQDCNRYTVTFGIRFEGTNIWKTIGWDWNHDCFTDGDGYIVACFPEASLKCLDNPNLLFSRNNC